MTKKSGNDNLTNPKAADAGQGETRKPSKQPNLLYLEIGKRIKNARESAHVTQEQLAESISVSSKQYISDLERGMVGASVPTIIKICDSLHASADYILLGVTSENAYSDTNRKIRELPADQQAMIDRGLSILIDAFEKKEQK